MVIPGLALAVDSIVKFEAILVQNEIRYDRAIQKSGSTLSIQQSVEVMPLGWTDISLFERKVRTKDLSIAVVGLGYVGLPLALTFAKSGFNVHGYDIDKSKIESLQKKINYHREDKWISEILKKSTTFHASTDVDNAGSNDVIIVAVPTPADPVTRKPVYDYIESAAKNIGCKLKNGSLVMLESTVGPGTTEGLFRSTLESVSGLTAGRDFGLGYSPERVNPGDEEHRIDKIPKVVSGIDDLSRDAAGLIYSSIVPSVHKTSTPTEAELTKLLENIQRDMNIALVNEFAKICDILGADIKNVIAAASTKWNFCKAAPGCGVGGHCLPDDPWFLIGELEKRGYTSELIKAARKTNDGMPRYTAKKAGDILGNKPGREKIAVIGLTYKDDVSDLRNTPAKAIIEEMETMGYTNIIGHDPHVDRVDWVKTDTLENAMRNAELVIVAANHSCIKDRLTAKNIKSLAPRASVIDGRNMLDKNDFLLEHIRYAGIGR